MMDELTIAMKAREFVARCGPSALPVSVDSYAAEIDGIIKTKELGETKTRGRSTTPAARSTSA